MMNPSSDFDRKNAEGKDKGYCCSYCERVFDNYQVLEDHQKAHEVEFKRIVNQITPFHDSMDITKSIIEHGNVSMKTPYGGTTINPCVMRGNSLFMPPTYSFTKTNNASLVASIPTKGIIPFSQYVNRPIYTGFPNNYIGHAPSASSSISRQFNGCHLPYPNFVRNPFLPGYHMTEFGLSKFPGSIKPSFVDTQAHSISLDNIEQISERIKKHHRDEVQEKSSMVNPSKRPNINCGPFVYHEKERVQKEEALFSTKDTKLKAIDAIVFKKEENNGSTSQSTNHAKEQKEADLDLSLHL